jgi:hypothetical protein
MSGLSLSPATREKRASTSVYVSGWKTAARGAGADVLRNLEVAESPRVPGVGLAVRNHLPVEVGHLLHEDVVLAKDGAVGSY